MTNNWLTKQVFANIEQWDSSLTTFYPESKEWMADPKSYLKTLTVDCNYLNAVKQLDWDRYLSEGCTVLDIGCGGGWLTAYLSNNKKIARIIAIDSSINYLENFLPDVVEQMNGNISKVETVQGFFSPVIMETESVDVIVISSAMHHADGITGVMEEYKRVLKPNGFLLILNETPSTYFRYVMSISKAFLKAFAATVSKRYQRYPQKISAAGFLYDPYLGDVDYPDWYWKNAIKESGLQLLEMHNSKLATIVSKKGKPLTHFICKKKS